MGLSILLKYFAGIGVFIGLFNTFFFYKRMKALNNNIANGEIKAFAKYFGVIFTLPFLLLQVFQLLGNYRTVFFIFLLDFNNPFYVLGFISIILFWALLLFYIVLKNGAEVMAKYNTAFGNLPADKSKIKIIFVLIVLVSLIILLLGNQIMNGAFSRFEEMII